MTDADRIRDAQRTTWDAFSGAWEQWDGFVQASIGPVAAAMVEGLAVAPDQEHLEVAAGTGEPGLTIAGLAPEGRVVLTDLSAQMLAAAERFAAARGLGNVEVQVASADDLPFADAAFDSVGCRFGLMFLPDLDAAATELARVVRSGGRVAAAVWAGPESNPWATLPMLAVASEVEVAVPGPDQPGLFRCAGPGLVAELFARAGLAVVADRDVPVEFTAEDRESFWRTVTDLTPPIAAAMGSADDAGRARIADRLGQLLAEHGDGDGVRLPGLARCTVATKP